MKMKLLLPAAAATFLLAMPALAQKIEAVHAIDFNSSEQAKAALGALTQDPAMKGTRVTLYAKNFGDPGPSHLIVEDFDSYAAYMDSRKKRLASHGWSRFLLQTMDSEYQGSTLVMVVDDHGALRHTAGYLAAYLIHTTDPAAYRSAIAEMTEAVGHPGVMRLVAMRTGGMAYTHAVLVGGADFKAVNEFLDKLFASDAFADFVAKVGDTRNVVGVDMYERIATWGD